MTRITPKEWHELQLSARNIVDAITVSMVDAEIIIKYKNHIKLLCDKTDTALPESFRTAVDTFVQNEHEKKGECKIVSDAFSLFFKVIQGKSFELALECLTTLNDMMAEQVQKNIQIGGDQLNSWTILQLLLCIEGELHNK